MTTSASSSSMVQRCKTVAPLRKLRHWGRAIVEWIFTFAVAAYNLVRIRNLTAVVT